MTTDQKDSDFWASLSCGDQVSLGDEKSIKSSMASGKGVNPEQSDVLAILDVSTSPSICKWRLLQLERSRWLVAKIVDENVSILLYAEAQDWEPITRSEALERGMLFLFQRPEKEDYRPEDLLYSVEIPHEAARGGDVAYVQKPQGEIHGKASWTPKKSGLGTLLATVVEYLSEDKDEPELMVLELGASRDGVIKFMTGRALDRNDVDVIHKK